MGGGDVHLSYSFCFLLMRPGRARVGRTDLRMAQVSGRGHRFRHLLFLLDACVSFTWPRYERNPGQPSPESVQAVESSAETAGTKVSSDPGVSSWNRQPRLDGNLGAAAASDMTRKPRRCPARRAGVADGPLRRVRSRSTLARPFTDRRDPPTLAPAWPDQAPPAPGCVVPRRIQMMLDWIPRGGAAGDAELRRLDEPR